MTAYLVEIHRIDDDDDPRGITEFFGPFRSYIRALEIAERLGKGAGLNLNTTSGYAGTDGVHKTAWVTIRKITAPETSHLTAAIERLLWWFHPQKEETE